MPHQPPSTNAQVRGIKYQYCTPILLLSEATEPEKPCSQSRAGRHNKPRAGRLRWRHLDGSERLTGTGQT